MKCALVSVILLLSSIGVAENFKSVAIGDSITAGFNAGGLFTKKKNSWSTGDSKKVTSHSDLIEEAFDVDVESYNFSVAGSKIDDMKSQVDEVIQIKPDYVTLLIGANDVCSWPKNYDNQIEYFKKTLSDQLARIVENDDQVRILLVSIPDLYRLWEVGSAKNGCQMRWSMFGICKAMLGKNRSEIDRMAVVERWADTNTVLAEIADEFPNQIKFSDSVQDFMFIDEDISKVDCFHPSVTGQNMLSETTWKDGWFSTQD